MKKEDFNFKDVNGEHSFSTLLGVEDHQWSQNYVTQVNEKVMRPLGEKFSETLKMTLEVIEKGAKTGETPTTEEMVEASSLKEDTLLRAFEDIYDIIDPKETKELVLFGILVGEVKSYYDNSFSKMQKATDKALMKINPLGFLLEALTKS